VTVCVGVAVHDCLVFAADSASTLIGPNPAAPGQSAVLNVYRHGNKVFNLYKKLPIAAMTCGMGNIGTASIGTIAKDLRQNLTSGGAQWKIDPRNYTIADVAAKARTYIFNQCYAQFQPPPAAPHSFEFWIGGYDSNHSTGHQVYKITILNGQCAAPDAVVVGGATGLFGGGQLDPINRLVVGLDQGLHDQLVASGMAPAAATQLVNHLRSRFEVQLVAPTMPVQDAIELTEFLTETTKSFYRFLPGADIVGGDTDIAVVTRHEGFKWIKRKHYYPAELNPLETDHA
jgi:hypothetical protein